MKTRLMQFSMVTLAAIVLGVIAPSSTCLAVTVKVPSQQSSIQTALNVPGVTVVQVAAGYTNHGAIAMVSGVRIEADPSTPGQQPIISADTTIAVTFPVLTGAGTVLSGFRIINFTDTGVTLPSSGTNIGRVEKCTIENGIQGIFSYQACEIVECTFTGQSATAIMTQGTNHATSLIQDNWISLSGVNTYGIRHQASGYRGPLIKDNTVGGAQFGVWIYGSILTPTPIENNLVVYCSSEGISCAYGVGTVLHNFASFNGINYVNCGGDPPANNSSADPILCNQSLYTIDINSPCAIANNAWSVGVGKKGNVGCATLTSPSELYHSTTLSDGEVVEVPKDFKVPQGKSLTLNAGVTFVFNDHDDSNCGADTALIELGVEGNLYVNGTASNRVRFISKNPSGHDWYAVTNTFGMACPGPTGGGIYINYAEVRNSEYGVYFVSPTSGSYVSNSTFYDNEIAIGLYHANDGAVITADSNTIVLGTGDEKGIILTQFVSSVVVSSNTIVGNAGGIAGIDFIYYNPGGARSPAVIGNTVTGFTNGSGISVPLSGYAPRVTMNVINGCKYGIYTAGGSAALIGDAADASSDNIVTGNTHGVWVTGSNTAPVIRNNQITGNTYGVTKRTSGSPNIGTLIPADDGKNDLSGNTTYCIWNQTAVGITAVGNYFGTCDGGGNPPVCWSGLVFTESSLCLPPAGVELPVEPVPIETPMRILGNWPNPSSMGTAIRLDLASKAEDVTVEIYNVAGQLLRLMHEAELPAGIREVVWDGRDDEGDRVPGGLYLIRVSVDARYARMTKLVIAR